MNDFASKAPTLVSLKTDGDTLQIEWSDHVTHKLSWTMLRNRCPCATCRAERSQPPALLPVLKPEETVPVTATSMSPLGNYAYGIQFSDGHNTGIYSLDFLRELGEESASS